MGIIMNLINLLIWILIILYIIKWHVIYNIISVFISKWPVWLRWVLLLPCSFSMLALFVYLSGNWLGIYGKFAVHPLKFLTVAITVYLLESFVFVSTAAIISPKYKIITCYILGGILCVMYWAWPVYNSQGQLYRWLFWIIPIIALGISTFVVRKAINPLR